MIQTERSVDRKSGGNWVQLALRPVCYCFRPWQPVSFTDPFPIPIEIGGGWQDKEAKIVFRWDHKYWSREEINDSNPPLSPHATLLVQHAAATRVTQPSATPKLRPRAQKAASVVSLGLYCSSQGDWRLGLVHSLEIIITDLGISGNRWNFEQKCTYGWVVLVKLELDITDLMKHAMHIVQCTATSRNISLTGTFNTGKYNLQTLLLGFFKLFRDLKMGWAKVIETSKTQRRSSQYHSVNACSFTFKPVTKTASQKTPI